MQLGLRRWAAVLFLAASVFAGCGGNGAGGGPKLIAPTLAPVLPHYQHIVIAIQENRSFDNLFAGAVSSGAARPMRVATFGYGSTCANDNDPTTCNKIALTPRGFGDPHDPDHSHAALVGECHMYEPTPPPAPYNSPCRMNYFDHETFTPPSPGINTIAYAFLPNTEIGPYIKLANRYSVADEMFSGGLSPSFPGHVFIVAGEGPADNPPSTPWGCSEPPGDRVILFQNVPPVYPCFTFPTLGVNLDAAGVSWKYYVGETPYNSWDGLVDAYRSIDAVYNGPDYARKVVPRATFFNDVGTGTTCTLPAVSWITPNGNASDHAGVADNADGPYWIAELYETIAQSPCNASTAFLVVWDDSGGWFDSVPPPYVNAPPPAQKGFRDVVVGMRVPLLFIAPDASGTVSNKPRDFGAIIGFIEHNFGLPAMGSDDTDFGGDALQDMWVAHPAVAITPIPRSHILEGARRPYSRRWFLTRTPSAPDNE